MDSGATVYIHFVWATLGRQNSIPETRERQVWRTIAAEANRCGCSVIEIGGTYNHLHVLLQMGRTVTMAEVIKRMKGVSSRFINGPLPPGEESFFRWQPGYGAVSVSPEDVPRITAYLQRQKEHHADPESLHPSLEHIPEDTPPSLRTNLSPGGTSWRFCRP